MSFQKSTVFGVIGSFVKSVTVQSFYLFCIRVSTAAILISTEILQ
jgi:hypothetical protein